MWQGINKGIEFLAVVEQGDEEKWSGEHQPHEAKGHKKACWITPDPKRETLT